MKKRVVTVDLARLVHDQVLTQSQAKAIVDWKKRSEQPQDVPVFKARLYSVAVRGWLLIALLAMGLAAFWWWGGNVNTWMSVNLFFIAVTMLAYARFSLSFHTNAMGQGSVFWVGYYARFLGIFSIIAWIFSGRIIDHVFMNMEAVGWLQQTFVGFDYDTWTTQTYYIFRSSYLHNVYINGALLWFGAWYFRSYALSLIGVLWIGHAIDDIWLSAGGAHFAMYGFYYPAWSFVTYLIVAIASSMWATRMDRHYQAYASTLLTRRADLMWAVCGFSSFCAHFSLFLYFFQTPSEPVFVDTMWLHWFSWPLWALTLWLAYAAMGTVMSMHYRHLQLFRLHYWSGVVALLMVFRYMLYKHPLFDAVAALSMLGLSSYGYWKLEDTLMRLKSASLEHAHQDEDVA